MPKIARKAWRSDVEAGFRGQLVAKPCSVPQTSGFTVPDAIVNGVERQYGLRKHVCLNPHILSSYRPVRGREILRTEPQTAEKYGLPDTAIKQDLRLLDIWRSSIFLFCAKRCCRIDSDGTARRQPAAGERHGGHDEDRDGVGHGIGFANAVEDLPNKTPAGSARAIPIAPPTPTSTAACDTTTRITSPGSAPRATRIPISRVRCATAYAVTP